MLTHEAPLCRGHGEAETSWRRKVAPLLLAKKQEAGTGRGQDQLPKVWRQDTRPPQLTFLEAIPQARGPQSAHPWKHRTDTPKTSLANLNSQSSHTDGLETRHNKSKL